MATHPGQGGFAAVFRTSGLLPLSVTILAGEQFAPLSEIISAAPELAIEVS